MGPGPEGRSLILKHALTLIAVGCPVAVLEDRPTMGALREPNPSQSYVAGDHVHNVTVMRLQVDAASLRKIVASLNSPRADLVGWVSRQ